MSTIDLIILGVLMEQSMNAYELVNTIESKKAGHILKISKPAIYKSCKRLYKGGYLDGVRIREGESPEKVIYSINDTGKKYFYKLMEHFSKNLKPFHLEFNTFLWNIDKLDKQKGLAMLKTLQSELKIITKYVMSHEEEVQHSINFASKMIVKQYRMMFETLIQWIDETIEEYKNLHQ